jgi:hypothetical protein
MPERKLKRRLQLRNLKLKIDKGAKTRRRQFSGWRVAWTSG